MKLFVAGFIVAFGLPAAAHAADTYKIDPVHSSVAFSVRHMVISNVKGRFQEFTGSVVLENNSLKEATGIIQTKSIDTAVAQRDQDLRSANFFDAEKFSTITFKSKRVEKKGDALVLVGDFTMHGVTKELPLPVRRFHSRRITHSRTGNSATFWCAPVNSKKDSRNYAWPAQAILPCCPA